MIERTDPDGKFVGYTYDAASNRTAVITSSGTTTYTYDQFNQLETVTDPNLGVTSYSYDKAGNLIRTALPNNTVETREYDPLNQLVFLKNVLVDAETEAEIKVISSYEYTLDAVGNRLSVVESDGRTVEYDYDDLYRLIQEKISDSGTVRTIDYAYDPVGNIRTRDDSDAGLTVYTYNANDWLLSEELNGETTTYAYDDNGNTISRIKDAIDQVLYIWDYENRLIEAEVTTPTGTRETQYRYDAEGVRVASIVDGQETRYLIDTNRAYAQVLEEYIPDGTVEVFYVYGGDLISQVRDGQQVFYHVDGLGSTRVLTDGVGNVTDEYIYDAYGNLEGSAGSTVNNYLYAGEQYDPNLQSYYLRARYYNPNTGRFMSRDPFEGFLTEPLSLSDYPYVHGNPINAIDPTGLLIQETNATPVLQNIIVKTYLPTIGLYAAVITVAAISAEVYVLGVSEKVVTQCAMDGNPDCETGIPIVFYGKKGLKGKGSLKETTQHISDAINGTNVSLKAHAPAMLSAWRHRPTGHGHRKWYNNTSICSKEARIAARGGGPAKNCDEYPFFQAKEGGETNYRMGLVSLRLVPEKESSPQTRLMDESQLNAAGVVKGHPFLKWYGVVPVTGKLDKSFWKKRNKISTIKDFGKLFGW